MALEYRTDQTGNRADAGAISLAVPGGTVDGNLLLCLIAQQQDAAVDPSLPTGFDAQLSYNGATTVRPALYVGTRIASGDTSHDAGVGGDGGCAALIRWSAPDPTAPVNIDSAEAIGNDTAPISPSVTTTVPNCWIVYVVVARRPLTDLTGRPANTTNGVATDEAGTGPLLAVNYKYQAAAGASGTGSWTLGVGAGWTTYTIALAPDANLLPALVTPGIVKSVDPLDVTIANAAASGSANLTKGQVMAQCVPFSTWRSGANTDANSNRVLATSFLSGPDRVSVDRSGTTDAMTARVFVVEFEASRVLVQQTSFLLLATSGSTTAALSTTVDPAASFVICNWLTSDTGDDLDDSMVGYRIGDDGDEVELSRIGTAGNLIGNVFVVTSLDGAFSVRHFSDTFEAGEEDIQFPLDPACVRERSFVLLSQTSSLADDDPTDQFIGSLQTASNMRADRTVPSGTPNSTGTVFMQLIELADGVGNVQHGEFITSTAGNEDVIDTVDLDFSHPVLAACLSTAESAENGEEDRAESYVSLTLDSATVVGLDRLSGSTSSIRAHWEVVQWAEFIAAGAGQAIGAGYRHY